MSSHIIAHIWEKICKQQGVLEITSLQSQEIRLPGHRRVAPIAAILGSLSYFAVILPGAKIHYDNS